MHGLPSDLNTKFLFYLKILPVGQEVLIYCFFLAGATCLVWSVIKILTQKPKIVTQQWLEAEMQRKRLDYLNERRPSFKAAKEMDVYLSTLLPSKEGETIEPETLAQLANVKEETV